jgi:predicted DNA binding CopG/RHH family protein
MVKKRVPKPKSEQVEREFWAGKDSSEDLDWRKAERVVLPELRPSLKTISLRVPESMLEELKLLAHQRDVPYQSLMKVFLAERIEQELDRQPRGQRLAASGKPARG